MSAEPPTPSADDHHHSHEENHTKSSSEEPKHSHKRHCSPEECSCRGIGPRVSVFPSFSGKKGVVMRAPCSCVSCGGTWESFVKQALGVLGIEEKNDIHAFLLNGGEIKGDISLVQEGDRIVFINGQLDEDYDETEDGECTNSGTQPTPSSLSPASASSPSPQSTTTKSKKSRKKKKHLSQSMPQLQPQQQPPPPQQQQLPQPALPSHSTSALMSCSTDPMYSTCAIHTSLSQGALLPSGQIRSRFQHGDEWIRLNVGGTLFATTKSTITRCPGSMLVTVRVLSGLFPEKNRCLKMIGILPRMHKGIF